MSDTTAITSLLKIGRIRILPELFGDILVPPAVRAELLDYHVAIPPQFVVQDLDSIAAARLSVWALDPGEAEAIALALQVHADALLIDERRGRRIAEEAGLACLGIPAVLLMAKERQLIPSVGLVLNELSQRANLYLHASVREELLRRAGESL